MHQLLSTATIGHHISVTVEKNVTFLKDFGKKDAYLVVHMTNMDETSIE